MKFRAKTGEVFEYIQDARDKFCEQDTNGCLNCPHDFHRNKTNHTCIGFCAKYQRFSALLMGYEVIEDEPYDSSGTCGICEHSKPFGIYGMVKCLKTDRYLPCEHKCDLKKEDNMEKKDKPRLAEVLGIDEGAKFYLERACIASGPYEIRDGFARYYQSDKFIDTFELQHAINHPEKVIRAPRLTEAELAICKAVGAKWVSRADKGLRVELWDVKPDKTLNLIYVAQGVDPLARVKVDLFPSVRPGDCICVEEAGK